MPPSSLGWWAISGDELMLALRRVAAGEDPDVAYAELYANSKIEPDCDCPCHLVIQPGLITCTKCGH